MNAPATHAALLNLMYDMNGNLVTGDGLYRTYNSKNQLVSVRDGNNASAAVLQTFVHHPIEEKVLVKRTYWSNGTLKETVTYISDEFVRVTNTSGTYNTTYYFDSNADLIAQKNPDGTTTTLLNDIEGSVNVATNSTGGVTERTTYEPYGAVTGGGTKTRYTYEGKEADTLTGDIDFEFRKYRADWGLFTQPDNILQNVYDPQAINRYAFERNNPFRYEDPTGHFWEDVKEFFGELYMDIMTAKFMEPIEEGLEYMIKPAMTNAAAKLTVGRIFFGLDLLTADELIMVGGNTTCGVNGLTCTQDSLNQSLGSQLAESSGGSEIVQSSARLSDSTTPRESHVHKISSDEYAKYKDFFYEGTLTINKEAYMAHARTQAEEKYANYKETDPQKYYKLISKRVKEAKEEARKFNDNDRRLS